MNIINWIVWFVVAIGVLVTVHEFGHYIVARLLGVKVLRFSVGFGKPLLRWVGGADRTEYCVAAIPLGGYVKMLDEGEEEVAEADLPRAFNRQSLPVRVAVVCAGPVFNFIFAILAYWLVFVAGVGGLKPMIGEVAAGGLAEVAGLKTGQQIQRIDGDAVSTWQGVIEQVIQGTLSGRTLELAVVDLPAGEPVEDLSRAPGPTRIVRLPMDSMKVDDLTGGQFFGALGLEPLEPNVPARIVGVDSGSRAESAGLSAGDIVLAVGDTAIENRREFVKAMRANPEQALTLHVDRGGSRVALAVTPAAIEGGDGKIYGQIGARVGDPSADNSRYYATHRFGPVEAVARAVGKTGDMIGLMFRMLWKMLTLEVSVKNLSGPISIAQFAGMSADAGAVRFIDFLAIVSVSLGVLNLLPIPMLDGGHLLYYAVEAVTRRPVSEQLMFAGQRLGIALLFGLMGLAFYNDIVRLFG
ncbi:MAG: RIP metalloprotease RseP [Gammaproteobacteria bacterium]